MHTYVCVSVSKKRSFFGKIGVLCFFETPVLRFTFLLYCRQIVDPILQWTFRLASDALIICVENNMKNVGLISAASLCLAVKMKWKRTAILGNIYLFKDSNRNTSRCKICLKLLIKAPEWRHWPRHWRRSIVFIVIPEYILHLFVVFLLLAGQSDFNEDVLMSLSVTLNILTTLYLFTDFKLDLKCAAGVTEIRQNNGSQQTDKYMRYSSSTIKILRNPINMLKISNLNKTVFHLCLKF